MIASSAQNTAVAAGSIGIIVIVLLLLLVVLFGARKGGSNAIEEQEQDRESRDIYETWFWNRHKGQSRHARGGQASTEEPDGTDVG